MEQKAFRGRGGIRVDHNKNTMNMPVRRMTTPPEKVVIAMQQCIGAPCVPTVAVGDKVKVGQKIGDSDKFMSVPVHASISGTVTAIGPIKLAGGQTCTGVTITSDGAYELDESVKPPVVTNKEEFLRAVRESGAVGLGGAGFPTHVKLNVPPEKRIDTLIVNAAECEPYITVDYREALDNSWDVLSGVNLLKEMLGIPHVIIAVEDNKPEAISELKKVADKDDDVDIMTLKSRYPQGAEKMMVYSATGRKVPAGGLPADVGCIVMNIGTVAFIARYIKTGKPLVSRSLTLDGPAVNQPQNVRVPVGTILSDLVEWCGGFKAEPERIVFGGPMMGMSVYHLETPLCKSNNALLAFDKASFKKERACINCGRCVHTCPMSLTPTLLVKAAKKRETDKLKQLNVMVCMECGCCAYSCPSGIPLVQYLRMGKQLVKEEKK